MSTNNYQQQSLFKEQRIETLDSGPETCLGKEFPNSEARRAHFTEELRKKLHDPEFRKIEGFPIGSDEDILNLSDPPYYTACPNPWIADFIAQWEKEKKVARVREWLSMKSVGQAFRPALNFPEIREFQKKDLDYVHQYQRRLPHWELPGSSYFITFRTHKNVGQPFQAANTANTFQPASQLNMPNLLEEALWFFHQERYLLDAYVIMPDHVHLLIRPTQGNTLAKIMQGLKGYTAMELNKIMKRKGSFWQDENFDHLIRNGADWLDKFEYIHNNPVKAGLVENPEDYPYSSLVTLHAEGRLESLPHTQLYHREPFAADVSEGKNDPIYNAHSYHTKVPHKAIMRYILHYTQPGDIVFDGFCGTGMTGVAAQMCGDREVVMSLGYQVKPDGTILQEETDKDGKKVWKPFSKLGVRRAVLNDLSPAATFIAYNYNTPVDVAAFEKEAKRILREVEEECGWMYETLHTDGKTKGKINYTVWSDVFVCPECAGNVVFWDVAVDKDSDKVFDEFNCPNCKAKLTKRAMERAWTTRYDNYLMQTVRQSKQVPVLLNYTVGKKRFEKSPDSFDTELSERIEQHKSSYWVPVERMMVGKETRRNDPIGLTHVHHFYTNRDAAVISCFLSKAEKTKHSRMLKLALTSLLIYASKLSRWRLANKSGPLAGTLYVSSTIMPLDAMTILPNRIKRLANGKRSVLLLNFNNYSISTNSSSFADAPNNSVDYIFTDPPFGANLNYSELSFFVGIVAQSNN